MCGPNFRPVITLRPCVASSMKVCVVGGGTSGMEAAREAEARGADVTVVEKSDLPDPPWRSWPAALGPGATARSPPSGGEGGWTLLRKEAKSVREDRVTTADGRSISADG
ncbi:MAG: NAD-binding protein, partial [Nitrososphaerota archaeon]|nr:NAD-binding protein [Nitrososphaerota archaeon]